MFGDLRTILFANFDNGAGKLREPNDLNRISECVSEPFEALIFEDRCFPPYARSDNSAGWSLLRDIKAAFQKCSKRSLTSSRSLAGLSPFFFCHMIGGIEGGLALR